MINNDAIFIFQVDWIFVYLYLYAHEKRALHHSGFDEFSFKWQKTKQLKSCKFKPSISQYQTNSERGIHMYPDISEKRYKSVEYLTYSKPVTLLYLARF